MGCAASLVGNGRAPYLYGQRLLRELPCDPSVYEQGRLLTTDEQLLANYVRGEQQAFVELIGRYRQELFAFLCRFVGESSTAEDLFQETFIQVHRNAESFDPERRVRPWLFTIAANKARDYLRSHGRRKIHSLDSPTKASSGSEGGQTFIDLMDAGMMAPPMELERAEDIEQVKVVLAAMPTIYREILLLSYYHGFSYKEMADALSIPLGTVKSRLHAGLATFAKAFKKTVPQGESF